MVIVTGSSRGLGKAFASHFLSEGKEVVGLSRTNTLTHPNFKHISVDLASAGCLDQIKIDISDNQEELILINNAGWIGPVKPTGKVKIEDWEKINQLNLTTPMALCTWAIKNWKGNPEKLTIINISSGAARSVIPSWAGYCATKAGLDQFSLVLQSEYPEIKVFSVSPGVVDTEMQAEIRDTEENDFAMREQFRMLKNNGELKKPEEIVTFILELIKENPETIFSVREHKLY